MQIEAFYFFLSYIYAFQIYFVSFSLPYCKVKTFSTMVIELKRVSIPVFFPVLRQNIHYVTIKYDISHRFSTDSLD